MENRTCIWPDCTWQVYECEDVHLCRDHFRQVGSTFMSEMRRDRIAGPHANREQQERHGRRQAALKAQEQVYYVRIGDRIKIGFTNNVRVRMGALRVPVTSLLATEPGGRELERARHLEFAGLRDGRREDFWPHARLMRHIDQVRETHGSPKVTYYPKTR